MGSVVTGFSMSLDGFVAGPNDDVQQVFAWMFQGDSALGWSTGQGDLGLKVAPESAALMAEAAKSTGALITGRRLFDLTGGWGGKHPLDVPVFVVTHSAPTDWAYPDAPFTFVTDGVERAIAQAQRVAGPRRVVLASTTIVQQCLRLGLLDEIHIDLVPALLGAGVPLFDHLGGAPVELERTRVVAVPGVTHLSFRVRKTALPAA
jgi:dihydrofolate reductase